MPNTGVKITLTLQLRNITTDTLTGDTKPNLPGDPDYIPPQVDNVACPIDTSLVCTAVPAAIVDATTIGYELSLPQSVIANSNFKKLVVELYNSVDALVAFDTYTDFSPNYFADVFTGLAPDDYYITLRYQNISNADIHTCPQVTDISLAPVITWEPINPFCVVAPVCELPAVYNSETEQCEEVDEVPATPPSEGGGTPANAERVTSEQWNNGGAQVFHPGYPLDGTGTVDAYLTTPHFWVNGNFQWDAVGRNNDDGRMNWAGVWVQGETSNPLNEWIGFVRRIDTPVSKTVYVGLSADNAFMFSLNGTPIVDCHGPSGSVGGNVTGGPNFNFFNIYPVVLAAGTNYIEMWARNYGSVAGMAMEIYDMTLAELIAATEQADLNVLFSTHDMDGEPFDLGETIGWSCPVGYSLDNSGPGDPVCRQVVNSAPSSYNTGYKGWADRRRLVDGVPDGYEEENLDGVGLGTYFPPVEDLVACPLEGIFTAEYDSVYV